MEISRETAESILEKFREEYVFSGKAKGYITASEILDLGGDLSILLHTGKRQECPEWLTKLWKYEGLNVYRKSSDTLETQFVDIGGV